MRSYLKDHSGTAIAIALGLLALLVAGTGTAVGAVNTVVSIGDSTIANRVARVDQSGRLSVAPAASTLNYTTSFLNTGVTPVSSPTSATLVVTGLSVAETRLNSTINGSDLSLWFVQLATTADGTGCTTNALRYILKTELSSGLDRDLVGSAQVQVKPFPGQAKYCLGIYSTITNGGADSTTYYPTMNWSAYVAAGAYTGIGTGSAPAVAESAALPPKG